MNPSDHESKLLDIKLVFEQNLDRKYSISIPMSLISSKVEERLKEMQPNFSAKGFRKGKAPLDIVRAHHQKSLFSEVSQKILSEAVAKIISDNSYNPASTPKISLESFDQNTESKFYVEIELMPKIPEINYSEIKLVQYQIEPDEKEINDAIKSVISSHKDWQLSEDAEYKVKNGDLVKIDYTGKTDGKEFAGGSAKDYDLEIGSKSFIDNFEEQLTGKKVGDDFVVKVVFPSPYHKKELAGKNAEFEVKIKAISINKAPSEITDELIKKVTGLDDEKSLREKIRSLEIEKHDSAIFEIIRTDVFKYLEQIKFDLPKSLVQSQFELMWKEINEQLKKNPNMFSSEEEKEAKRSELQSKSEKMTMFGILLSDIASKNSIFVSKKDWEIEVEKLSKLFGGNKEMVSQIFEKNNKAKESRMSVLHERKIIEFIASKANLTTKQVSIAEFGLQISSR